VDELMAQLAEQPQEGIFFVCIFGLPPHYSLKLEREPQPALVDGIDVVDRFDRPVKFWSKTSQNWSGFATFLGCHTPRGRW
jgi:hypothetical protein